MRRSSTRTILGCVALLLLATGCEFPYSNAPSGVTVLDPAALSLPTDVLPLGLKVAWAQNLTRANGGLEIARVHAFPDYVVIETLKNSLVILDKTGTYVAAAALSPALDGGLVQGPDGRLYGTCNRQIMAVDPATGAVEQVGLTPLRATACPAMYEGDLMVGGGHGRLVRLSPAKGREAWTALVGGGVNGSPVVIDDTVCAAGEFGFLGAFYAASGITRWEWRPNVPGGQVSTGIAASGSQILIGDTSGTVTAIHVDPYMVAWQYPLRAPVMRTPYPFGGKVFAIDSHGVGTCIALNEEGDPEALWETGDVLRAVAHSKTRLYVLHKDRTLEAVNAESGRTEWRLPTARRSVLTTGPDQSTIYVFTPAGAVVALEELDMD